ncbi:hypothetical protein NOX82_25190 [Pseudomonas citronellolis]|uniref:hypothetical protein n=1 Tax=Pseudomonas citronellolis TaxID=53408 RepID=UPI002111DD76|nr:hypothetical protein [Pseudomonas citronellolis]UUC49148.1 hypothetical protein NOX82_25190 [Pseudomonas citronellolis]
MLDISDADRAYLNELRALSIDSLGNEIFVGLTLEESNRFAVLSKRGLMSGDRRFDDGEEYLTLHDKHEMARMRVLAEEHVIRTENPTKH